MFMRPELAFHAPMDASHDFAFCIMRSAAASVHRGRTRHPSPEGRGAGGSQGDIVIEEKHARAFAIMIMV